MKHTKKQLLLMGICLRKKMQAVNGRPVNSFLGVPLDPQACHFQSALKSACNKYSSDEITDYLVSSMDNPTVEFARECSMEYQHLLQEHTDASKKSEMVKANEYKRIAELYGNIFTIESMSADSLYIVIGGRKKIYLQHDGTIGMKLDYFDSKHVKVFHFLWRLLSDKAPFWNEVAKSMEAIKTAADQSLSTLSALKEARMAEVERIFTQYGDKYGLTE